MKKSSRLFALLLVVSVLFTGCLTCEKKDFVYIINKDGSVNLTITYFNIMSNHSESEEEGDSPEITLEEDYQDLMSNYLGGTSPENDYANVVVESKRLYEYNGKLNGEVKLKFSNLADAKVFADTKHKIIVKDFCTNFSETLESSNGTTNSEKTLAVWDAKETKLTYTTFVSASESEGNTSLLGLWKKR